MLIALLGGAALIGGIYFGGGMGGSPPAATEQPETQPAQSESSAGGDDFSALEEAPSVPLSEAVTNRADRQTTARTPEREPQRTTREEPQRTVEREPPRREPAASTAANSAATPTGPAPLFSPQTQGNQGAVPLNPQTAPPIQTANVEPSILGSATPPQTRAAPGNVVWTQRPSARRISELYPRSALNDGVGGRVVLDCRVLGDLSASCSIASETPSGAGFGRAAMSAASSYRARATLSDGSSAIGSSTRIAVNFQAPQR